MSKIKSITCPDQYGQLAEYTSDDYEFSVDITEIEIIAKEPYNSWIRQTYKIKDCKVEYEKPTLLKRPDGSLISEPEQGQKIICISLDFSINNLEYYYQKGSEAIYNYLKQGLIFLPEDRHLAEKKAEMLTKQLEIQHEIDRLNAEEGDTVDQDFVLFLGNGNKGGEVKAGRTLLAENKILMSEKTAETILAKYSQEELKQYLGIII